MGKKAEKISNEQPINTFAGQERKLETLKEATDQEI